MVVVVAAAGIAVASVSAAEAAAPSQFRQSFPFTTTDATCGFPVVVNLQVTLVGRVYFDSEGNPVSAAIENSNVGTDTANGVTLSENDHWVDHVDFAAGSDKQTGIPIQIRDGGVVVRDAGYILCARDGSVTVVHGPHSFIEGDPAAIATYCAAFS